MRKYPDTNPRDLHFACAIPGGSKLIPPCKNCQQGLIDKLGAGAHGYG
jgi:hypothetical protein